MEQTNNKDFKSLDELIGYLTILFDFWYNDYIGVFSDEKMEEERDHFNNAIQYIKDLEKDKRE